MRQFGLTRPDATTGARPSHPASRGANAIQFGAENISIPFPPAPHELSARALLKRGYVAQALIDSTAVLFCFLFLITVALSIPLSLFLLFFASFD